MADATMLRRRNLSALLDVVHRTRGVTRAELARTLRVNRSTIGDLVGVLVERGWVEERDDAPRGGVGRPSPRVVPTERHLVAAVNPELDAVTVALVAIGGRIVARRRVEVDTPDASAAARVAAESLRALAGEVPDSTVVAVGVAVPGLVRAEDGLVRLAPHLEWRDEPFAERLRDALELPVFVANDADLGARAELLFGAGRDARDLLYVNGGPSGIGAGIVSAGSPVSGVTGYAGELGHVSVDPRGPRCACGATGCLEAVAQREDLVRALGLDRPDDDELETALVAAVAAHDAAVIEVRDRQLAALAVALRGAVNLLNPHSIVLGGHLAALWEVAGPARRDALLADALPSSRADATIVRAELGSGRLLIGAAELAWEPFLADPAGSLAAA